MKKIVLLVVLLVIWNQLLIASGEHKIKTNKYPTSESLKQEEGKLLGSGSNGVLVINALDSVFFDLATATSTSTTIEIPVYMRTDDIINALDFSFKYDHSKLDYDTIINMTGYIDALSFYNTNDSTVRLTSYSFSQPYVNDTILFLVKFNILSGQLCSGDLNTVTALLNGDACSQIVVECLNSGLIESENELNASFYPNPASDYLEVTFEKLTDLEIADVTGKRVFSRSNLKNENNLKIDTSHLNTGIYFVRFINGSVVKTSKLLVE